MESDELETEARYLIGPSLQSDLGQWDHLPQEEKRRIEKQVEDLFNEAAELRRNGR